MWEQDLVSSLLQSHVCYSSSALSLLQLKGILLLLP